MANSKLRLTQVRKTESAEDHEHDLRGLGDDRFLAAGYPFCRLVVTGSTKFSTTEQRAIARHGLTVSESTLGTFVLTVASMSAHSHKRNAVALFAAALELGTEEGGSRSYVLEEVRPFGSILRDALRTQSPIETDVQSQVVANAKASSAKDVFEVSSVCVTYLQEAGFKFEVKNTDASVTLDRNARVHVVSELLHEYSANQSQAKVG